MLPARYRAGFEGDMEIDFVLSMQSGADYRRHDNRSIRAKLVYLPFQYREMLEMSSFPNSFQYYSEAALLSRLQLEGRYYFTYEPYVPTYLINY